jgi:hypothetical protein
MSICLEQMKLSGFLPDPDLQWNKIADPAPVAWKLGPSVPVPVDKQADSDPLDEAWLVYLISEPRSGAARETGRV